MSCPFKYLLGKPGLGIHKYRVLNTAIVDYIMSLFLAAWISYKTGRSLTQTTIFVLVLSMILHWSVGLGFF